MLLLSFSIPIWAAAKNDIPEETEDTFHVRVVAQQFAWNVHYPGPDGEFGKTDPKLIDPAINPIGLAWDDPPAADDWVAVNDLRVPVNKLVRIDLSSMDVIHSLFLPIMRVKQDAIPGMRIPVWFRVKIPEDGSDATTGRYEVACAQLCGSNHYSMKAYMVVQTPEDYAAWLVEKSAPPEEFDEDE